MSNIYHWLNREKNRYYTITVQPNGNSIVLNHRWGGCYSNRGGKKAILVQNSTEAKQVITQMMKRRKSRGYELVAPKIK